MTDTPIEQFYGFLGRADVTLEQATLRVYPFGFSSNDAEPVCEIFVDHPGFSRADLNPFFEGEVEVTVYPDRVQIDETLESLSSWTFQAQSVRTTRKPYDLKDYSERVATLDKYCAQKSHQLHAACSKLGRLKSVAEELIRRAEIKANVSHEHSLRQAGSIEALRRILAELEMDD